MKTFHCSACQALVFFENTKCLNCGRRLAFAPDLGTMIALTKSEGGPWKSVRADSSEGEEYRLCGNYERHGVCNWALGEGRVARDGLGAENGRVEGNGLIAEDGAELCLSCCLTQTIPDLSANDNAEAWAKLEAAKRRLIYALLTLRLPLQSKVEDPAAGLAFSFRSDALTPEGDRSRVLTGHDNGLITINVAEADDVYRETQRLQHREPYRTVLGHFRHEIGHYYWDRLLGHGQELEEFRRSKSITATVPRQIGWLNSSAPMPAPTHGKTGRNAGRT